MAKLIWRDFKKEQPENNRSILLKDDAKKVMLGHQIFSYKTIEHYSQIMDLSNPLWAYVSEEGELHKEYNGCVFAYEGCGGNTSYSAPNMGFGHSSHLIHRLKKEDLLHGAFMMSTSDNGWFDAEKYLPPMDEGDNDVSIDCVALTHNRVICSGYYNYDDCSWELYGSDYDPKITHWRAEPTFPRDKENKE